MSSCDPNHALQIPADMIDQWRNEFGEKAYHQMVLGVQQLLEGAASNPSWDPSELLESAVLIVGKGFKESKLGKLVLVLLLKSRLVKGMMILAAMDKISAGNENKTLPPSDMWMTVDNVDCSKDRGLVEISLAYGAAKTIFMKPIDEVFEHFYKQN